MIAGSSPDTRNAALSSVREADDRIYLLARAVAVMLVGILAVGASLLYVWPMETDTRFAWPISPKMTPLLMGSGYFAGAYYFLRMALGRRWSRVGTTTPAVATFASIMLVTTLMHWANFTHDHLAFYIWTAVYIIAPPLVVAIWYFNGKRDPGYIDGEDRSVPGIIRVALLAIGLSVTALSAVMFFAPETAGDFWVWAVSPLTSRIVAGWFMLSAVTAFVLAYDRRWGVWRVPFETMIIWAILIIISIFRAWDDFTPAGSAAWLAMGFVALVALGFALFYMYMERTRQTA